MKSKKYVQGFNDGYLLRKHKPILLENIINISSSSPYIQGLKDAEKTFSLEKSKTRLNEIKEVKESKSQNKDTRFER